MAAHFKRHGRERGSRLPSHLRVEDFLRGIPHGFDEKRSKVNYWEPWYLGYDPKRKEQREKGVPNEKKPRTGPYARMIRESSESEGYVGPSCNLSEE